MLKKLGLVISTLVGLLTAVGSGMQTSAQPADLSVQFSQPNLQEKTSMSENSQSSVEERTRPPRRQESSVPCPACGMG